MLSQWYDYRTHCVISGTGQSGKSTCAEHCMREHVIEGNPFWLIDWHGPLYEHMLRYLIYNPPSCPVYLINPSQPDFIVPFNPFRLEGEVSAHAMRMAEVIVKPWGEESTNELPTYERLAQMLIHAMVAMGEPLHHAVKLLELPKRELREYAISLIGDDFIKQHWKQLQYLSATKNGFRDWKFEVLSAQNRLMRFVASKSVKLFTGLPGGLETDQAIQEGAIVLMNFAPSPTLPPHSGKVFAALALSELLYAALKHANEERETYVYLDECQNYLTSDGAKILDQVLKAGMRITLIHHHLGQFAGNIPLLESIKTNCQIKLQFNGASFASAKEMAEEFFYGELNQRLKKDDRVHYVTEHKLEKYQVKGAAQSVSDGESVAHGETTFDSFSDIQVESGSVTDGDDASSETSGWSFSSGMVSGSGRSTMKGKSSNKGSSKSVQKGTRYRPELKRILDGQEDYGRDEKVSMLAARFMGLPTGTCWVKVPDKVYKWEVPWVEQVLPNPKQVIRFIQKTQPCIPLENAERILEEQERTFLERGRQYESRGARPKKRPPRLFKQG